MKQKITVVLCVLALFGLSVLAVEAWQSEKGINLRQQAAAYAQMKADEQREEIVRNNYTKLNDECKKGQAVFDSNSAVWKKAHAAERPQCDLPIAE